MSLLDQVVGAVTSKLGAQGNAQSGLMEAVLGLINNNAGGLSGLVQAFSNKGLADVAASWVSTGKNLPINPEQIQSVLGNSRIQEIAQQLGLSSEAASSQLSQMLPMVVDKLTPDGQIPSNDLLAQGMNLLKGKLFR
ncbi:MAG: YidB family protein [Pseudomonadota bacterium]